MGNVLFTWVGQWVSVPAVWDGSCMLARGWNGNVIVLLKAKFQWKRLPSFLWLLPSEENWKEKLTVIQRPQLSEIIPLLVQNHYIWIKDVLGMLLILKLFKFFYLHVWRQKETESARVELCWCSEGLPQDSARPVNKLQCPERQLMSRIEDHFQNYAVIW